MITLMSMLVNINQLPVLSARWQDESWIYFSTSDEALSPSKGAFTLARFRGRFRTKFAHLVMKNFFKIKMC
jgi:hypothetical protein